MSRFNFGKTTRQQGACFLFGIIAGTFAYLMQGIIYQPIPGIVFGIIAIVTGLILLNVQKGISSLVCLSLIPLGLVIMVYGMNSWPLLSFAERFTESMLTLFYTGYFIYCFLHGIRFLGEAFLQD